MVDFGTVDYRIAAPHNSLVNANDESQNKDHVRSEFHCRREHCNVVIAK